MSKSDEKALKRFFAEKLVPAAEALRGRGVGFFATGPDGDAASWYEPPPDAEPDFEAIDESALDRALRERWGAEGLPELVALAALLLELSRTLEIAEVETPEISPFVYVMY